MTKLSRRDFGRIVAAGVPLTVLARPFRASADSGLTVGVSTDSFRAFTRVTGRDNVDDIIRATRAVGAAHVELAFANFEPAPPSTASFMGGSAAYPRRVVLTPEQVMATNASARGDLRAWRAHTPPAHFADVRAKFEHARLTIHACNLAYHDSFTDEEIDATLRQAVALGVTVVASPLSLTMAKRLAPFAERHHVAIAIHNQASGTNSDAMTAKDMAAALALSPAFRLKLDLGNLTASNDDAVAVIRMHQTRVSHVLVKDRLRNGGVSQVFGEGDTPIAAVLEALKASPVAIPVFVEYDYVGLRTPEEEVRASLEYVKRAIQ